MTNSFENKSLSELIKMVRGEAVCENCNGNRHYYIGYMFGPCKLCNGARKQPPLSDDDLNGLTAIHCEGWDYWPDLPDYQWESKDNSWHTSPPSYTTDPRHAMRLMVKYKIDTLFVRGDEAVWSATVWTETKSVIKRDRVTRHYEELERAITEAAVIAALMEVLDNG